MGDLRAVVVGAGWAAEGHTRALRWCGVDVEAICGRDRAPVLPAIHDFRARMDRSRGLTPRDVEGLEWRPADADWAFTALLRFDAPRGEVAATVAHGPGVAVAGDVEGMRLYGDSGTLLADGMFSYRISRVRSRHAEPEPLPVPPRLMDRLPDVGDEFQNKWCALARDFVADIRGEPHEPYLTFRDGWRYQVAVDAIRSGAGWRALPG